MPNHVCHYFTPAWKVTWREIDFASERRMVNRGGVGLTGWVDSCDQQRAIWSNLRDVFLAEKAQKAKELVYANIYTFIRFGLMWRAFSARAGGGGSTFIPG